VNTLLHKGHFVYGILTLCMCVGIVFALYHTSEAATVDELRNQITQRNQKIQQIEQEIAEYEQELSTIGKEKQTLQSAIRTLEVSQNRLQTDIELTENKIDQTELQIEKLSLDIEDKELRIKRRLDTLAASIRSMDEAEGMTLLEGILQHENISEFLDNADLLSQFQEGIRTDLAELKNLKTELSNTKEEHVSQQQELIAYQGELGGQKQVIEINKREKSTLLTETKNEESTYQELLAEKKKLKEQFEQELFELESQLEIAIDPSKIPSVGSGVLAWPLPDPSPLDCVNGGLAHANCITQFFGNTPFASANAQVYGGKGHNGIDFRAPVGSKVLSALSGTVAGIGDTDQQPGCYSYGKWVLIRHNNGLSTLYAHLSHISVVTGQSVSTGETIGFSGNTGYSTGPHLHFTVYATEGVKIVRLGDVKKITNCGDVSIPVADLKAYLNPLSFL